MGRKKVIIGVNDLSSKYPDLVKEWDYEKNTIKPSRIYAQGHQKVWWLCDKGHSYDSSPADRVKGSYAPLACKGGIVHLTMAKPISAR